MKREHAPNPGVTWDTRLVSTETVADDDPADTSAPDINLPQPPHENRATRRAKQRAARRKTR